MYSMDTPTSNSTGQQSEPEYPQAMDGIPNGGADFRLLAEMIPQLAWMARADGAIFWYNRRWYDYTGKSTAEMEGWGWQSVHDPVELPRVMERWQRSIQTGDPFDMEFPLKGIDGRFRWFLTRVVPILGPDGRPNLWFGSNTDVHDQKQAEIERQHLLEQEQQFRAEAERNGKLKDEFLATLSHELRTPLNAILGWSQILKGTTDVGDLLEGLEVIDRNARAQAQIIDDILDMSRIISGKLRLEVQPVDLAAVVQAALDTVRPAARAKEIELRTLVDPVAGPVNGDPNRLQQVFWNLLSNAVKFTPKGGRVQVTLQRVNSGVEVSIVDNGEGIEPNFLPHVFDRFRQADASTTRRHGGLGLGLAIVKQLVELHGGEVQAQSRGRGEGSRFILSLPVTVIHNATDTHPAIREHPDADSGSDRDATPLACDHLIGVEVLVVEDDPDSAQMVRRLLVGCGATVRLAGSAVEAMEQIKRAIPRVLVSDIGMPGEDGYALIRRIRLLPPNEGGQVRAVALTAYARVSDRVRALEAGFQMHIAKPVDPLELVTTIAALAKSALQ